jgi:uncharacterized protein with HEPN domain
MSTEREALRLQDIIDNIDRIESYVAGMDFAGSRPMRGPSMLWSAAFSGLRKQ